MIKHQGLAQLADTVNTSHYPVRRRGQKRQLNPNWVGIAWLEAEALEDTEILQTIEPDARTSAYKMGEGLAVQHSRRAAEMADESVRERPLYVRPMFQVFNDTDERVIVHHGTRVRADKSCADCYDFQYPGRDCPRHPVKRLARNHLNEAVYWEERGAARPAQPVAYYSVSDVIEASVHAAAASLPDEQIEVDLRGIQEDLPREGMQLPDEMWRNLVEAYTRMQSARQAEEEPGVAVESVDQEGRPSRITWRVEAENERNAQRRRLRGYWTEG